MMKINVTINGEPCTWEVRPDEPLLETLRRNGYYGAKHGCETGECGACAVLVDGRLRPTCVMLGAQASGCSLTTIEGLTDGPGHLAGSLHPLQQCFIACGAIQCGYCTPAMILGAKELLDRTSTPTEDDVRDHMAGVLCRCTGYQKPVEAVLRAAALMRGDAVEPLHHPVLHTEEGGLASGRHRGPGADAYEEDEGAYAGDTPTGGPDGTDTRRASGDPPGGAPVATATLEKLLVEQNLRVVGKGQTKVDGVKLATGRPAFVDDLDLRGMLTGKLLLSPVPHARIKRIDVSRAKALPGVHAVLTHKDLPRVTYTSAGQSWPEPGPKDMRSLDDTVRFVGDRVAAVAAETPQIAEAALRLIEVEYEELPAVFDPREAIQPGAPLLHTEADKIGFAAFDFDRNLPAIIEAEYGDVQAGFDQADLIVEGHYYVPQVQQTPIEPHVTITYWDEDDRLVVRTSTQVPFHVRRIIAPLLGLPVRRIRVIKPRIGGGFGVKQEVLIEDICGHLTMATGRPVRLEFTRTEEFYASRSRHAQYLTMRTGVKRDGTITANQMVVVANTGAYGGHALTVQGNTGSKTLPLYRAGALHFKCDVAYTNLPPAGAFRGYGGPQGFFALESHMDMVAKQLGRDPMAFRAQNWLRVGDTNVLAKALGEGKEGFDLRIASCGLDECRAFCEEAIGWREKRHEYRPVRGWIGDPGTAALGSKRRGVGGVAAMHGTAIPGLDMGGATIKINDDGSFNVQVGATDIGTGADTVLAQIAAEVLGCRVTDIIIYSSDTDMTPFDTGAYASSTTYISGGAVKKAAEQVADQIRKVAAKMLGGIHPEHLQLRQRKVVAPDGRSVTLQDAALHSLHVDEQHQIAASASQMSYDSPPPFATQFAEVEVDVETGEIRVLKIVSAVDCGRAINPITAEGQIEGGAVQALGYGHCEEMVFDNQGRMVNTRFGPYRIYTANEMPALISQLVETADPFGPFGAKAVAEIPIDGVAPAIANAVYDAIGVRLTRIPLTPERVLAAIREQRKGGTQA